MTHIMYVILIFMTFIGSIASLFLKKASNYDSILSLLKNKNLYIGAGLYLLSAVLNIIILKYLNYSTVLPLTSLTYVWTMVVSRIILKEKLTSKKIIGTTLIFIGAIFVIL